MIKIKAMIHDGRKIGLSVVLLILFLFCEGWAESEDAEGVPKRWDLTEAGMCENIRDHRPYNRAVVFSVSAGKIYCFTEFSSVPEKMYIYHNWYRMDHLSQKIKLLLNVPAWSTYSSIQLREADVGPWRIEITDNDGNLIKIIRFSITE